MTMRERRERGKKLPQVKPKKKIGGGRIREKEIEKKRKGKKKRQKRKAKREKKKNEGESVIRERGDKKKGTTLPFAISD